MSRVPRVTSSWTHGPTGVSPCAARTAPPPSVGCASPCAAATLTSTRFKCTATTRAPPGPTLAGRPSCIIWRPGGCTDAAAPATFVGLLVAAVPATKGRRVVAYAVAVAAHRTPSAISYTLASLLRRAPRAMQAPVPRASSQVPRRPRSQMTPFSTSVSSIVTPYRSYLVQVRLASADTLPSKLPKAADATADSTAREITLTADQTARLASTSHLLRACGLWPFPTAEPRVLMAGVDSALLLAARTGDLVALHAAIDDGGRIDETDVRVGLPRPPDSPHSTPYVRQPPLRHEHRCTLRYALCVLRPAPGPP